jgi:hypothetical protein
VTYTEQLQKIANDYRAAGQPWPATKIEIAQWAINNNRWQPQPSLILNLCADELAGAMREEIITDQQGRKVRAKHVAKMPGPDGEEQYLWDDIRTASREHMHVSAQMERQQIASWCYRLKVDIDSFNQNNSPRRPIQISFDFRPDNADREALEKARLEAIAKVAS